MEARFAMQKVQPEAVKAMLALSKYVDGTSISKAHKELIKIRASQINGCAYCINMHTRDARKNGETEQRIYLLNAWRETNLFSEEERAILALTEQITLVNQPVVNDAYEDAARLFSEAYLAEITMAVVTINSWNRIAITTRMQPD